MLKCYHGYKIDTAINIYIRIYIYMLYLPVLVKAPLYCILHCILHCRRTGTHTHWGGGTERTDDSNDHTHWGGGGLGKLGIDIYIYMYIGCMSLAKPLLIRLPIKAWWSAPTKAWWRLLYQYMTV